MGCAGKVQPNSAIGERDRPAAFVIETQGRYLIALTSSTHTPPNESVSM